jgi:hypothetical protein
VRYVNRQIYARESVDYFDQFTNLDNRQREKNQRLKKLGQRPSPDDVDAIMGSVWTYARCSQCSKRISQAVEMDLLDFENGNPVVLCIDCIDAAKDTFYERDLSE